MPPFAGVPITISGGVVSIGAISESVPPFEPRMSIVWTPSPVIEPGAGPNGPPSTLTSTVTPSGFVMFRAAAPVNQSPLCGPLRAPVDPAGRRRQGRALEVEALVRADGDVARGVDGLDEVLELRAGDRRAARPALRIRARLREIRERPVRRGSAAYGDEHALHRAGTGRARAGRHQVGDVDGERRGRADLRRVDQLERRRDVVLARRPEHAPGHAAEQALGSLPVRVGRAVAEELTRDDDDALRAPGRRLERPHGLEPRRERDVAERELRLVRREVDAAAARTPD